MKDSLDKSVFYSRLIFVVATALIFFLMGLTLKHVGKVNNDNAIVTKSFELSLRLEELYSNIKNLETERRNFILTEDRRYQRNVIRLSRKIKQEISNIEPLVVDDNLQSKRFKRLKELVEKELSLATPEALSENITGDTIKIKLLEGNEIRRQITRQIYTMLDDEKVLLYSKKSDLFHLQENTPVYLYILATISLTLLAYVYIKTYNDIKQQRLVIDDLKNSRKIKKLSEMVGSYGIWTYNIRQETFYFSDNLYRLFGLKPQSITACFDALMTNVHPEDYPSVKQQYTTLLFGTSMPAFHYRILTDENIRHIQVIGKIVELENEEKIILGVITDITEEYLNKIIIEEKNASLEANNKELQAFNYVASHDLQEPLRKIETFLSRLKDTDYPQLSDKGKQYTDRALASAGRMRNLIDDLLQFSRSTRSDQVFETSDFNNLMNNALEELQDITASKNAQIKVENLPIMKAIPFQIQQLFINLISNSLKYSKENISPEIHISVEKINESSDKYIKRKEKQNYYRFTFQDNGIGFEQQYADKIFTLFNRLHGKQEYEGTGIGLAICKKIVENHNGYIYAESEPQKGTKMIVLLPEN